MHTLRKANIWSCIFYIYCILQKCRESITLFKPDLLIEILSFLQKTKLPTSSNEFILAWRKVKGPEARAEYLNSLLMTKGGSLHLATIFKHEIPFALLGEFIKSMENKIELFDDAVIADFLQSLSHTGRFDLSLTFLGSDEKQSLNSILNHLEKSGTDTSDLKFRYAM